MNNLLNSLCEMCNSFFGKMSLQFCDHWSSCLHFWGSIFNFNTKLNFSMEFLFNEKVLHPLLSLVTRKILKYVSEKFTWKFFISRPVISVSLT